MRVVHLPYCWKPFRNLSGQQWLKSTRINFGESGDNCSILFRVLVICSVAVVALALDVNQNEKRLWKFSGEVKGAERNSRSSMSVVHSFSLTMTVEHQPLFTYRHMPPCRPCSFPVSFLSRSRRSGGAKPLMCSVSSSLLLFNHISLNARIEAVLYSCIR